MRVKRASSTGDPDDRAPLSITVVRTRQSNSAPSPVGCPVGLMVGRKEMGRGAFTARRPARYGSTMRLFQKSMAFVDVKPLVSTCHVIGGAHTLPWAAALSGSLPSHSTKGNWAEWISLSVLRLPGSVALA